MRVGFSSSLRLCIAIGLGAAPILDMAQAEETTPLARAAAALQQKHWEEARALSEAPISSGPASGAAYRIHAWALYRLQKYPEALHDFSAAARLDPRDADAALGAGRCHRLLKQYDAAVADFTHASELAPRAARPLCERGAILILQEKFDASLADYVAAEKLDPSYPALYSYFAEVYLYRREPAKALAAVQEGLKREPDSLIYRVNEAHSYLFLGNTAKAMSIYLANKDRLDADKKITFAQIVLTDFRLMRTAGVTHPDMAEIETAMQSP